MSGDRDPDDTVQSFRARLSVEQIELLDEVWREYARTGSAVPRREIHLAFGSPSRIKSVAAQLGKHLLSVDRGPGSTPKAYAPTLLGVLVSSEGEAIEALLVNLLGILRERVRKEPQIKSFPSEELLGHVGLDEHDILTIGRLFSLPMNGFNWGGSFSSSRWEVTLPEDVDELVDVADLGEHVRKTAAQHYDSDGSPTPERPASPAIHPTTSWETLLHSAVRDHALPQFRNGHWRDAVLNAYLAVFELLKARTGLGLDGDALITRSFSAENPILKVADTSTQSGKNDQLGFMRVLQGSYQGVRNVKAHGLHHDLDALKAAQYLVAASLLARRIDAAQSGSDSESREASGSD